ncbi:hypothetical protein [Streptomyces smyrnaeus]|uniref:hypothetical protein n=1 Tax=Streptomyces smyrnaeus TaxID=1387713 RepID=UPI0033DE86C2
MTAEHFVAVLEGRPGASQIKTPLTWLRPGRTASHLVAGGLSSLRCLLGTL